MHIELTPEQATLRQELRRYFAALVTPDVRRARGGSPMYRHVVRRLGRDGWLGIGWPKEYGGQDRTPLEQLIFFEEASRAKAPVPLVTVNTVGPTLMRYGTDEQKRTYLPAILAGEVEFAIGYSEPGAGTDLAALRTRAARDGEHYVVNGSKVFTSGADHAEYVWLACRTDPGSSRHHGLSLLIVPTDSAGFSWSPIDTIIDRRTTATYYDDVRVPVTNLVGTEGEGWKLITAQLNHERIMVSQASHIELMLQGVTRLAATTKLDDGGRLIDRQWVQLCLARVAAIMEYVRLANWRSAVAAAQGTLDPAWASAAKVFSSEMATEASRLLFDVAGQTSYLRDGSPDDELDGVIEGVYRLALQSKSGGGTNEIQRELIAQFGLGMPRAPR